MQQEFRIEPQEPESTRYTAAFEACWSVHRYGTKLTAWKAGVKKEFTPANWLWPQEYLEKRHKLDLKWIEGKYIPHLSSIINGERWHDNYPKKKQDRYDAATQELPRRMSPEQEAAAREAGKRALQELKGIVH